MKLVMTMVKPKAAKISWAYPIVMLSGYALLVVHPIVPSKPSMGFSVSNQCVRSISMKVKKFPVTW